MIEVKLNPYPWQNCSNCRDFHVKLVKDKGMRYVCGQDEEVEVEEDWGKECIGFRPRPHFDPDLYMLIKMEAKWEDKIRS